MRPIRLELEGFTSFRENTVVDFGDTELFVLWGPTGSGKSSLIDAMTFALYGSVSRYQNEGEVYHVISQGKREAKVRFDFSLAGTQYTAVRVVRRQRRGDSWGGVTREVRLESGGEVLAGSVTEFSAEVKRLFGLSFDQFTTCVVLPQGEFARFLQASGRQRQDLLTELLRLSVYREMGTAARNREKAAATRGQILDATLAELGFATEDALRAETQHAKQLAKLAAKIEAAQAPLSAAIANVEAKNQQAKRHASAAERLGALQLPAGVESLHEQDVAARQTASLAAAKRVEAERALEAADAERARLPEDASQLGVQLQGHETLAKQRTRLASLRTSETHSAQRQATANDAAQAARAAVEAARATVREIENAHRAHALAAGLAPGDPCPVCQRALESAPKHAAPPGQSAAQKQLAKAEREAGRLDAELQAAIAASASASADAKNAGEAVVELEAALEAAPASDALREQLAAIQRVDAKLDAARAEGKKQQQAERSAAKALEDLAARLRSARAQFGDARDALSGLRDADADESDERWRPPAGDDDDLVGSWRALLTWCGERRDHFGTLAADATRAASEAARARDALLEDLSSECAGCSVRVPDGQPHAQVVAAELGRSEAERARIAEALERASRARDERRQVKSAQKVAAALAGHLRANAFERWLLSEAFDQLVLGASVRLGELSGGAYAFAVDDRLDFQIIDHRNADETRSARTLSGGETFLASLALALTLAEQIAGLAADGAAPLESMFLDEGFGTLDPETLDTVASSIEELGARGRMVGLVTHVRDLAERIPTQFRVSKLPSGSVVEKLTQ